MQKKVDDDGNDVHTNYLDKFLSKKSTQKFLKNTTIAIVGFSLGVLGTAYLLTKAESYDKLPISSSQIIQERVMLPQASSYNNEEVKQGIEQIVEVEKEPKLLNSYKSVLGKTLIEKDINGKYTFKTRIIHPSIDDKVSLIIDSNGDGKYSKEEISRGKNLPIINGYAVIKNVEITNDKFADVLKNSYVKLKGEFNQSVKGTSLFAKNYDNLNFSEYHPKINQTSDMNKNYIAKINSNNSYDTELKSTLLGKNEWLWKDRADRLNTLIKERDYSKELIKSIYTTIKDNKSYQKQLSKGVATVMDLDKILKSYV